MLCSQVLALRALDAATLPVATGYLTYGLFLDMVRRMEPDLGRRFHRPGEEKPFTVSPLSGAFKRRGRVLRVLPGDTATLRFTSLDAELSALLVELAAGSILRVGTAPFTVDGIATHAAEHPWTGRSSYELLAQQWLEADRTVPRTLSLEFATPTTFRRNGYDLPCPLPELVFREVVHKWRRHAPPSLRSAVDGWYTASEGTTPESRVLLKRFSSLETRVLQFEGNRKGLRIGFTGQAEFLAAPGADLRVTRVLQMLADFAFYSGIGYQTTWGMGQVRRCPTFQRQPRRRAQPA